ncbi:DinB family protein [Lewinella sp. JB7]|uniref:DinB family protein n=1 Tax=Lewinella sp. JB7 TaxID=2962887 RepID=UPI0020C9E072|nr:DinB family protein [Lewinella sp. JB7]MCP9237541.1 DUF1572 domain-containing protein [Lewinella sp. JB7]
MPAVRQSFLAAAVHFLQWNRDRIAICLQELTEEEVWLRPNEQSNSVGNQLLHLNGNIRQWILTGLGGKYDDRIRDAEFSATEGKSKEELYSALNATIAEAIGVVQTLDEATLTTVRPVQAFVHDGTFIVLHVVEHLSYHTGQIVFWTKQLRNKDLDLYGGVNLNQTN